MAPPAPPHAPQNGVTCPGRQQPSSWPATSGPDSGPLGPALPHSRTACTNTGASPSAPTAPSCLVTPGEAQQGTRNRTNPQDISADRYLQSCGYLHWDNIRVPIFFSGLILGD